MSTVFQASAPGRCGIVGNPSDIYGGVVVSCSVPVRNRCTLTLGETGAPDDPRLWNAVLARFQLPEPAKLAWETGVPRSSGLSGSTAMLAATLLCVLQARGEAPPLESRQNRASFAELVRDIERNEARIVCGYQDAYMIVHGGLQLMDFAGKHPTSGGPDAGVVPLDSELPPLLLITTGVERLSGSVHGPMVDRWLGGERAVVEAMHRLAELGRYGADSIEAGNLQALAEAMNENQEITRRLGGSGPEIDALVASCLGAGAEAAKLAGAGLGGTVVALVDDPDDLEARLRAIGYERFLRPSKVSGARIEAVS